MLNNTNEIVKNNSTVIKSAREETMSATPAGEIVRVEKEIDEMVKALYRV